MNQAALKNVRAARVDWNVVGKLMNSIVCTSSGTGSMSPLCFGQFARPTALTTSCAGQHRHSTQPNTGIKCSLGLI